MGNAASWNTDNWDEININQRQDKKEDSLQQGSKESDLLTIQSLKDINSSLSKELNELKQSHFETETKLAELRDENVTKCSVLTQEAVELKQLKLECENKLNRLKIESDQAIQSLQDANDQLVQELNQLRQVHSENESRLIELKAENSMLLQGSNDTTALLSQELAQYKQFKVDSDAYIVNLINEYAKLNEIVNKQNNNSNSEVETQTENFPDELFQSIQLANYSLNQELAQYKQFKVDSDANTAQLLNEYAKVNEALQEKNGKSLVDNAVQAGIIESKESDLQLIQSLKEAIFVLNKELDESKQIKLQDENLLSSLQEENEKLACIISKKPTVADFEIQFDSMHSNEADLLIIQSLKDANLVISQELSETIARKQALVDNSVQVDMSASNENDLLLIQSLRDANNLLNQELNQLKQLKLDSDNNIATLNYYLGDSQAKFAQLNETYNELNKRLEESENVARSKQAAVEDLIKQIGELKANYEQQISAMANEISALKAQKDELNNMLLNTSMHNMSQIDDATNLDLSVFNAANSNNMMLNTSSGSNLNSRCMTPVKNAALEAQLNFCREKCESVMAKMASLKAQNDAMNRKMKSIKSLMI